MPRQEGYVHGWKGVTLRYSSYGEGEPAIVCCNGLGVSTFFWKYVVPFFAERHRVITWDYRGHNGSALPLEMKPENFSVRANAADLRAVLDDAGVSQAVLLGHSMGCQVILEFWRRYPERVVGLVPICGPYGRPIDTFFGMPWLMTPIFDVFYALTTTFPRVIERALRPLLRPEIGYRIAKLGIINEQLVELEDMLPYFEHLQEMNLEVFFLMAGEMQRHSAGPWLDRIDAPTLIVGGEKDLFTPLSLSHEMRERIPNAQMLLFPKGSHAGLIEHPELLNLRIEKFIREQVEPYRAKRKKQQAKKKRKKRKRD